MRSYVTRRTAFSTPSLILSLSLLFVGISLILPLPAAPSESVSEVIQSTAPSTSVTPILAENIVQKQNPSPELLPTRIIVPKLGIDLKVQPVLVINGYWQVAHDSASYGIGSGIIGEKGNSVIFAHARPDQFLPLKKVTLGTRIYVVTPQKLFTYEVKLRKNVSPTDLGLIQKTPEAILTLYTCDGINDSERLVVQASAAGN